MEKMMMIQMQQQQQQHDMAQIGIQQQIDH